MINWKVRIKNKMFWLTIIPMLFLLVHRVLIIFGVDLDLSVLESQILDIVEVVFSILACLGIVTDLTTAGVSDSARAMGYLNPYDDKE